MGRALALAGGPVVTLAQLLAFTGMQAGDRCCVSDVGVDGSGWRYSGARWVPESDILIGRAWAQVLRNSNNSTDASYITEFSCTLPGGLARDGSILEVTIARSMTNSASTKRSRLQLDATTFSGPSYANLGGSSSVNHILLRSAGQLAVNGNVPGNASGMLTSSYDMSADRVVSIASAWSANVSGEFLALESALVKLLF